MGIASPVSMKTKKFKKIIISASLFIICALFLVYFLIGDHPIKWGNEHFSSEKWLSTPKEKRYIYYRDLVNRHIIDGLSLGEVVAILGEPNYISPDSMYITYDLKYINEYTSFDAIAFLHINFDNGKVSSYYIRTD